MAYINDIAYAYINKSIVGLMVGIGSALSFICL